MMSDLNTDHLWYWINNIEGVGRRTIYKILEYFGDIDEIFCASEEELLYVFKQNHIRVNISDFIKTRDPESIINNYSKLKDKNIQFIHRHSDLYPKRLINIPDAPYGIYLKGKMPDQNSKSVAIIGARNSTYYGREMARCFARELSEYGIVIVSGLARGIDGMAHRGALEVSNYTLGILGCGIDQIYPKENYELFMQMEHLGGIISESNMGVPPNMQLFPQRNRLISGMADGILVIEAREKSGTFITIDQGLEQGREIFALPGRVMDVQSVGCNNLIKMGAHMVTDTNDILEILFSSHESDININNYINKSVIKKTHKSSSGRNRIRKIKDIKNSLAPTEKIVYSVLSVEPKFIDEIISETMLSPQDVCMILNKLSLDEIVNEPVRNYYSIKL